jgi:hypothetical protein
VQDEGRVDCDLGVFQCRSVAVGACAAAPHSCRATNDGDASVSEFRGLDMVRNSCSWRRSLTPSFRPGRDISLQVNSLMGLRSSCECEPRAQIFTAKLTALFSHAALPPTSGKHENRCETTDTADWPAAYVMDPWSSRRWRVAAKPPSNALTRSLGARASVRRRRR